jgi:hypothetical protein
MDKDSDKLHIPLMLTPEPNLVNDLKDMELPQFTERKIDILVAALIKFLKETELPRATL